MVTRDLTEKLVMQELQEKEDPMVTTEKREMLDLKEIKDQEDQTDIKE